MSATNPTDQSSFSRSNLNGSDQDQRPADQEAASQPAQQQSPTKAAVTSSVILPDRRMRVRRHGNAEGNGCDYVVESFDQLNPRERQDYEASRYTEKIGDGTVNPREFFGDSPRQNPGGVVVQSGYAQRDQSNEFGQGIQGQERLLYPPVSLRQEVMSDGRSRRQRVKDVVAVLCARLGYEPRHRDDESPETTSDG